MTEHRNIPAKSTLLADNGIGGVPVGAVQGGGPDGHLDFMAAANEGAVEWHDDQFAYAPDSLPLAWLQYRLHQRLFAVGTALALDIAAYWHATEAPRPTES
jgi:hypothetical protein